MLPDTAIIADRDAIRADLSYMTARWGELDRKVVFEVRAFREGASPQIAKFQPGWIDEAVEWIAGLNALGFNIYVVRNPIRYECSGSASDEDIVAAFFLWADCDDPASASNVYRFDGPKWSAAVTTGRTPSIRVHCYWPLKDVCTDMAAWRESQVGIAGHFGSDSTVINPSRIMRVGGTVSFPASHKRARGYVPELTTIRTVYEDTRSPVTLEQMARVFKASAPAAQPAASGLQIDTGMSDRRTSEQYADILRRARTDGEKHGGVRDLAASLAGSGVPRHLAEAIIRDACPVWDAGVEKLIDTAFQKFAKPAQPVYAPNFDHAPAPTPSDPAPAAAGWRVQNASEFVEGFVAPEYLIDGVVQRGRLYTLTAPTGSGKTAVMLYIATAMSQGLPVCDRETECGDVLYLAGENPDDVRARVIATLDQYGHTADATRLHFIPGTFSIRADMEALKAALAKLPNCILVVVDTLAAYFDGDDSNSNAQMLDFARMLRRIIDVPSRPAVIVPAHPVKNAIKTNLTPMGGSALLNEVDGNLCLWKRETAVELHWQGKHRGAEFDPLNFELVGLTSEKVRDSKGRLMPTVMARPLMEMRAMQIATDRLSAIEKLILNIEQYEAQSIRQRCVEIGMVTPNGKAKTSSMANLLGKLAEEKLARRILTNWELTPKGQKAADMIKNGGKFAEDLE